MGNYFAGERKFGWIRDPTDVTTYRVDIAPHADLATTIMVDLRSKCPPVWDQGSLSACTAFAVNGAYSVATQNIMTPSCLFLYYQERALEGTIDIDAGAILRDGYVALQSTGVCKENSWPYIASKFAITPSSVSVAEAAGHRIGGFANISQTLDQLKSVLLTGQALTFGFVVYTSFMSIGRDGIMPIPKPGEGQLGGHAVTLVGYDDQRQMFICRNSWGAGWGDGGYFYMPYSYALNNDFAGDYWLIK